MRSDCKPGRLGPAAYRECGADVCRTYTFGYDGGVGLGYRVTAIVDCRPRSDPGIVRPLYSDLESGAIGAALVLAFLSRLLYERLYTPASPLHRHLETQLEEFENDNID